MSEPARWAWLNGRFVPFAAATVPVTDRGFLFADGVYEVWAVLDGRLVDADAHLARLVRSAGELALALPLAPAAILTIVRELVRRDGQQEGTVYLQLTRGAAERDFIAPDDIAPTLLLFTQAKAILADPAAARGLAVHTLPDQRWGRRDIKTIMLLAQVLAKRAAHAAGADDAWLVDADGYVTEAASATAFIVTAGGRLHTRPNGRDILPGCTRATLAAVAMELGVPLVEQAFTVAEAQAATEAFNTSASSFVLPVVRIDDQPVGDGTPGPVARRLRAALLARARHP